MESKHWRVDMNMANFYEVFQAPENVQHVVAVSNLILSHVNHISLPQI